MWECVKGSGVTDDCWVGSELGNLQKEQNYWGREQAFSCGCIRWQAQETPSEPTMSLYAIAVPCGQPWSKNSKWKIPKVNNKCSIKCCLWVVWQNLALSCCAPFYPGHESSLCPASPHCVCYSPSSHLDGLSVITPSVITLQCLCSNNLYSTW